MFDEKKFPLAVAIFFTIINAVCAILIWLAPNLLLGMMKPMMHGTNWDLVWSPSMSSVSVIWGLVVTFALSYVLGWVFAKIYNSLK